MVRYRYYLPDPCLTDTGIKQAESLGEHLRHIPRSDAIILSSPMRRAIQTAQIAVGQDIPIEAFAELQEVSRSPCDTGTEINILEKEFPQVRFHVPPEWPEKEGLFDVDGESRDRRAEAVRQIIKGRKENVIFLVSHGGFLSDMLNLELDFDNAECRLYGIENDGKLVKSSVKIIPSML